MSQAAIATAGQDFAFPAVQELKVHNDLLGDRAALDQAWEHEGYWFFKGVLDRNAVGRLRAKFVEELERQGVVDPVGDLPTDKSVEYNGTSLAKFPYQMDPLAKHEIWREFVAEAPIHEFFTRLLGDEPFWVPVVVYRATPPAQDRNRSRLDGIHQDGPFSPGIDFRICWLPLAEIDESVGGLILAEGLTEKINRHPLNDGSNTTIPLEALPKNAWRRTTYEAGDVLLMNLWTPHTGLSNLSNRFRLSLDHRVMSKSDRCPIVGEVLSISPDSVVVRDGGRDITLGIEPDTYVRNNVGVKLKGNAIGEFYPAGTKVIVAHEGNKATVVRTPL